MHIRGPAWKGARPPPPMVLDTGRVTRLAMRRPMKQDLRPGFPEPSEPPARRPTTRPTRPAGSVRTYAPRSSSPSIALRMARREQTQRVYRRRRIAAAVVVVLLVLLVIGGVKLVSAAGGSATKLKPTAAGGPPATHAQPSHLPSPAVPLTAQRFH